MNPKKVKVILDMVSPKIVKKVQRLTRHIAALNRFVSKATDKCLLFFKFLNRLFSGRTSVKQPSRTLRSI